MKPIALALVAAGLLVAVAAYALPWFSANDGTLVISGHGTAKTCIGAAACTTQSTDGLGFDSTWLGLVGALKFVGALGLLACGGAAAMAQASKTQLGSGALAIRRGHLAFAIVIVGGLVGGVLALKPAGVSVGAGAVVAALGVLVGIVGLFAIKNVPESDAPKPA